MEELPGEVVLHVLSFLGPFDLLALQATSRSLQHFALDHALWRDLIRCRWHSGDSYGRDDNSAKDDAATLSAGSPFDRFWLRFRWLEAEMNVEEEESGGRRCRPKRTELVHRDQINSCALEKTNHTLLVTSSRDLTVRVWDIVEGKQLHALEGHTDFVYHALFFEKQGEEAGMKVVSTGADGTLRVWDVATGAADARVVAHDLEILALKVEHHHAVSGSDDCLVKLWDLQTLECTQTFEGHKEGISCLQVVTEGGRGSICKIASGSFDKTIRVFDIQSSVCTATFNTQSIVNCFHMDQDRVIASARSASDIMEPCLSVWDLRTSDSGGMHLKHNGFGETLSIAADGNIVVCGNSNSVQVWDLRKAGDAQCMTLLDPAHLSGGISTCVRFDGTKILIGSASSIIKMYDAAQVIGNGVHASRDLCGHTDVISDMDIDGFTLASASWDNTVRLWQF